MVNLFAIFAGLILSSAFAPFDLWFCAPIALAILLHLLSDRKFAFRFVIVLLFGLSFNLPLLSWSNTYVGNIPWVLLALLQTLLLFPLALIKWSKSEPWKYVLFPSVWICTEWILAHFPFGGFGWGRVGFSQANSPYAQIAKLGGVPLLSFFVSCLAVIVLFLFLGESGEDRLRRVGRIGGGVMASFVLLSLSLPLPHSTQTFSVLGVQGGVPQLGLDFNERAKAIYLLHRNATEKYLVSNKKKLDVVVWPENAIDIDPFENVDISRDVESFTSRYKIPLIAGAVTHVGNEYFNESILWMPDIGVTSRYAKQHLTPFGEYMPLRALAEKVSPYAENVTDFSAGSFAILHKIGQAKIAPTICYELLDDSLGRSINVDSNLMVVQTNSATFGLSAESAQQLNMTRIRAIEHQRYVISIATTGISAIINPRGQIEKSTKQNTQSFLSANVELIQERSFSDKYGSFIESALIFFVAPLIWVKKMARRGRNQRQNS